MRTKPYPLEALRVLRSRAQDAAATVYKEAQRALEAARVAHTRAQDAADAIAERRRASVQTPFETGAEVATFSAWSAKLQREHAAARELVKRTAAEVKRLTREERLAQDKLRQAFLERQIIERHHEKFAEAEKKRLQKIEDDEMDDLIPHLMKKRPQFPV
jgi:predicted transcriptional regulator